MAQEYIRIFRKFDIEEIKKGLLISGDLSADCAACQALGLDVLTAVECSECGTTFKYVTSRRHESHPGERFQFAKRMEEKRPDLTLIDYGDYKKIIGQKKARDFFG